MLVLTYNVPARSMADIERPQEREWHVGDAPLCEQLDDANLQVVSIVADGEEARYIRDTFVNLPMRTRDKSKGYLPGNVPDPLECVWRGELARFIFDNLR